ncbi:MAG: hypothetical protein ACRCZU_01000 [Selenomonadaceae bacterium]
MEWYEDLPKCCPPADTIEADAIPLYRLVKSVPPTDNDFVSLRKMWPSQSFRTDECTARSLSTLNSEEEAKCIIKLPTHSDEQIIEMSLQSTDGKIKRTLKRDGHYSWWRSLSFKVENLSYKKV